MELLPLVCGWSKSEVLAFWPSSAGMGWSLTLKVLFLWDLQKNNATDLPDTG